MRFAFAHDPKTAAALADARERGVYVSDIGEALQYRRELFGAPFRELLQDVMRGASEWSAGERELFAAFVSSRRRCPF